MKYTECELFLIIVIQLVINKNYIFLDINVYKDILNNLIHL